MGNSYLMPVPAQVFSENGTRKIDIAKYISNIPEWSKNLQLGKKDAATYKSKNKTEAYFYFLNEENNAMGSEEKTLAEFRADPDSPVFKYMVKYMIVAANIIISKYCDSVKFSVVKKDYSKIGNYNGVDADLIEIFDRWAHEINPLMRASDPKEFIQIRGEVGESSYPIALFSKYEGGIKIYPYNTISRSLAEHLYGFRVQDIKDANGIHVKYDISCSMADFISDITRIPGTLKELVSAFNYEDRSKNITKMTNIKSIDFFEKYLNDVAAQRGDTVKRDDGTAFPLNASLIGIDNTPDSLPIPVAKEGILNKEMVFSEKVLIVKSNLNTVNNELCYSPVSGQTIGRPEQERYAIVPPISEELAGLIMDIDNKIKFKSSSIESQNGRWKVTVILSLEGTDLPFYKEYNLNDVKVCDKFPILSVIKESQTSITATVIKTDTSDDEDKEFTIDNIGRPITIGNGDLVSCHRVDYNSPSGERKISGYLIYDEFNKTAARASDTAIIIDVENSISEIALFDSSLQEGYRRVKVYNDKLFLFEVSNRADFNTNKYWGRLGTSIFMPNGTSQFALPPFTKEFNSLVKEGRIQIDDTTKLEYNLARGVYEFNVDFHYIGHMHAHKVTYNLKDVVICKNPPFIAAVSTYDPDAGSDGHTITLVRNMAVRENNNVVDSNKLKYIVENGAKVDLYEKDIFWKKNSNVYISLEDENNYYGMIDFPFMSYIYGEGFNQLKDDSNNCAALLIVNSSTVNSNIKVVIKGNVFSDNMLIIADDSESTIEQNEAMRNNTITSHSLLIDAKYTDNNKRNINNHLKRFYALFPFSSETLINLVQHNLELASIEAPKVEYDQNKNEWKVAVTFANDGAPPVRFEKIYTGNAVKKCENFPFIIPLTNNGNKYIARFNNDSARLANDYIDGSTMHISVDGNELTNENVMRVDADNKIIDISVNNEKNIIKAHMLYSLNKCIGESVICVRSDNTNSQCIFDFKDEKVEKLDAFTEYMMWTKPESDLYAGNSRTTQGYTDTNQIIGRIYSIPLKRSFTKRMEERGIKIDTADAVEYKSPDPKNNLEKSDPRDGQALFVKIQILGLKGSGFIEKKYRSDQILRFFNSPIPTLTVFPYVDFVSDGNSWGENAGESLWNSYSYSKYIEKSRVNDRPGRDYPLGTRVKFYFNSNEKVTDKNGKEHYVVESKEDEFLTNSKVTTFRKGLDDKVIQVVKRNYWTTYIHMVYDPDATVYDPNYIDTTGNATASREQVDNKWAGQELGCLLMKKPPKRNVNKSITATVGVDFGTRNSIIAIKKPGMTPTFEFHGPDRLLQIIIPTSTENDFNAFTNLSYIPTFKGKKGEKDGCGKFASSVMVYESFMLNGELLPYDSAFVPNVSDDVLNQLMNKIGDNSDTWSSLGYKTDLKLSSDSDDSDSSVMDRCSSVFIKTLLFHIVLNCYNATCGSMDIRVSMPSPQFSQRYEQLWNEAKKYISECIPQFAVQNIEIEKCETEANALFTYLDLVTQQQVQQGMMAAAMPTYSVITDGGDGTYDFTINCKDPVNGGFKNIDTFSLRYAGQQIMTNSIRTFITNLKINSPATATKIFVDMWNEPSNSVDKGSFNSIISQLMGKNNLSAETSKTLILLLVEQFGIKYSVLNKKEYINFVSMVQYKFLFIFNVLGEQIKAEENGINFNQYIGKIRIYLYGGTAQALAIADTQCNGDISKLEADHKMMYFISSMLNLPKNPDGSSIQIEYTAAADSKKHEICSGLTMYGNTMNTFSTIGTKKSSSSAAGASPFDNMIPIGGFEDESLSQNKSITPLISPDEIKTSAGPSSLAEFYKNLTQILMNRTIEVKGGKNISINQFIPFIKNGETNKMAALADILTDTSVKQELQGQFRDLWNQVKQRHQDITNMNLVNNIYTLEMVTLAIETYLKKVNK